MADHLKIYWRRPRRALQLPTLSFFEPPPPTAQQYPAWVPRFERTRNATRRRLQTTVPVEDFTVAISSSRSTLVVPFITRDQPSRRRVSLPPPVAEYVGVEVLTAQGFPGWLPPPMIKRRETHRTHLQAPAVNPNAPITPQYPSWVAPPKLRLVVSDRVLITPRELDEYPPPTAPPVPYPAWPPPHAHRTRFVRALRALPQLDVHTATPPYPSWALPPTHRSRFERRLQTPQELNEYPPPPPPSVPYPAWLPPKQHRRVGRPGLLLTSGGAISAPTIQDPPSYKRVEAFRTSFKRRLQVPLQLDERPFTAQISTGPRPLVASFVTRSLRSRRLQVLPHNPIYPTTPVSTAQGFPAWLPPIAHRTRLERALQTLPPLDEHPPLPPTAEGFPAWLSPKVHKTSLERTHQAPLELNARPATTIYPAWALPPQHRTRFERQRQRVPALDVYPPTPPTAQGFPAQVRLAANRTRLERRLQTLPRLDVYTATPPYPSWLPPPVHRTRLERTLQATPRQDQYAPPPTAQEYPSWLPPKAHRTSLERTLQRLPPLDRYAPPPPTPALYPSFVPIRLVPMSRLGRRLQTLDQTAVLSGKAPTELSATIDFEPVLTSTIETDPVIGATEITTEPVLGGEPDITEST